MPGPYRVDRPIERVSIELSTRCEKACSFCYSASGPDGQARWTVDELVAFATDLARHGVAALSLGGGEPLEWPGLFELLRQLDGVIPRTFTTSGLRLDGLLEEIVAARPDKVHVSLHFPGRQAEVARVARQVGELAAAGVPSGVNLLVARSRLEDAAAASYTLQEAGIGVDRIVFLPMRGADTPKPSQLAQVAGTPRFQSMTCLLSCGRSPRFASIDAEGRAAWCSYTTARRPLPSLDHAGLVGALAGLDLAFCGG